MPSIPSHLDDECIHGFFVGRDCPICLDDEEWHRIRTLIPGETVEKIERMQRVCDELRRDFR